LPAIDGAGRERLQPVESLAAHHDREVGGRDVVVAVRRLDGDGVGAHPRLGVRLTVVLLDAGWLEGGGPLDGPKLVGEGREGFVVARWPSGRVVASAAVVLVVGVGDAVFLIVPVTSLALGGVAFAMTIVDAWAQILLVELEAEVILVDLLSIVVGSCRVMTRLGAVGRVVLAYLLGLRGGHMQTSPSLDDLGGLLEALEHLEHRGQIGQKCGEDVLAVVVEDKVGVEVTWSDRRVPISRVAVVGILHVLLGLTNGRLIVPPIGADVVAAVSVSSLFVVLVGPGVGVVGDDEDSAMLRCR